MAHALTQCAASERAPLNLPDDHDEHATLQYLYGSLERGMEEEDFARIDYVARSMVPLMQSAILVLTDRH